MIRTLAAVAASRPAIAGNVTSARAGVADRDRGYEATMTNVNAPLPDPGEGFHEETPEEFATQPDRQFSGTPNEEPESGADQGDREAQPSHEGSDDQDQDQDQDADRA
jgi:hypothetical protein